MQDPIAPAVARSPAEAVELVCQAVSDGDLDAALAHYEDAAVLSPWLAASSRAESRTGFLRQLMELRLPLTVRVLDVVPAGELALVLGERQIRGAAADGGSVEFRGAGATLVRRQPGGGWRIVADAWRLAPRADRPPAEFAADDTTAPIVSPQAPGEAHRTGGQPDCTEGGATAGRLTCEQLARHSDS